MEFIMKMKRTNWLRPILATVLIAISSIAFGQIKEEKVKELSKILQTKLDSITSKQITPGATLSVLFNDGTNISIASGFADIENKIPMKPDDVMFSGSIGKTYVAAVILLLYEKGLIDLKAKAVDYLKDEPWFLKVANAKDITVEMLMNHTAGIPEYVTHKELWEKLKQQPDITLNAQERFEFIKDDQPTNAPGKGWAYADSHYIILGLIIEKITGKTYYDALNEMILKPCKLSHTLPSDKRSLPGLVQGYTMTTETFLLPHKVLINGKYAINPQMEWTGGGLISTVSDLTSWASQLYGGNVLKPETKKLMFTPAPFTTALFENAEYGLGCFIGKTNGITYYGHTGTFPGYIAYVQYIPKYNIAFAIQFNDDSSHDNYTMKKFFNTIKSKVIEKSLKK